LGVEGACAAPAKVPIEAVRPDLRICGAPKEQTPVALILEFVRDEFKQALSETLTFSSWVKC